ncbi:MAG: hypothetical protein ABI543_07825 [Ignavibacteria bacterium]
MKTFLQNNYDPLLRKLRILVDVSSSGSIGSKRIDILNKYDITEITLHRDLNWLRNHGIIIHSCKNRIMLFSNIDSGKLYKVIGILQDLTSLLTNNKLLKMSTNHLEDYYATSI